MVVRKSHEATDVLHLLLPQIEAVDIPIINIKTDTSTRKTKNLRGDIWISREPFYSKDWEREIVALIEAKPSHILIGTKEWNDAIKQGRTKASIQGLPFFIVTNTGTFWRYYRTIDIKEVTIDGEQLNTPLGLKELQVLVTQISPACHNAVKAIAPPSRSYSKKLFQSALWQVKNIYRNCAIDNSDSKIYTTIAFVVLKYISEQEQIRRTLPSSVMLWKDWRNDHIDRDIKTTIEDIRKSTVWSDVIREVSIASELRAEHCQEIRGILNWFQFSGCNFDLYGAVYESFADTKTKKEFGQYYTNRHITSVLSEILLRDELSPKQSLKMCDPTCGTGGFLTEAYRVVLRNYTANGALQPKILRALREDTFYGYDIKDRNISLARINMCLAGDGHTNINVVNDSLIDLPENEFTYILTNIPYGIYKGSADIDNFKFCNKRRYENLFLEKIVRALRPNGRAVVIIPDGILESPSLEDFRVNLLSEVAIEAVISLHPYVFRPYTTEKTYAIIFRKFIAKERGKRSGDPIWMYILENDGFQKGDKRYPIKENDIPDLKINYLTNICKAPHIFVPSSKINTSSFHNLLPEFHLNYYEEDYKEVSLEQFDALIKHVENLTSGLKGLAK